MSRLLSKRVLPPLPLPFFPRLLSSSAAAAAAAAAESSPAVRFLVETCGLPLPSAVSAAASLPLKDLAKARSVVALFLSHGFSPSDLSSLLSRRPALLLSRPDSTLRPKLLFLLQEAAVPPALLLSSPSFLSRGLDSHLRPTLSFLARLLPSPDHLLLLSRRNPWFLTSNLRATVLPNSARLDALGVPRAHLAKLLTTHPRALMARPSAFDEALRTVADMGVDPSLALFVHAVRAVTGMARPTWDARMAQFARMGWSKQEVRSAFCRVPLFVLVSDRKLRRSTDYLTKEVGLGMADLSRQPKLFMYSLEKRVKPRFEVFKVLRAKGLVKGGGDKKVVVSMFTYNEKSFLERYVERHSEKAPELMDVYRGKLQTRELVSGDSGHSKVEEL